MKQKLILISFLIGLTIVSQPSFSLGMSKIQINSVLDMPLDASIRLLLNEDESQHQYTVKLASSADYQKVGLDKSFVPSNIQVSVDEDDPSLVNISSLGPISDPIVSLLLDVSWSNGRLLREFTILLDPPVYTSSSSPQLNDISTPENTTVETTPGGNDVLEDNYAEETKVKSTKLVAYDDVSSEVFVSGGDTLWGIASRNKYGDLSTHQMMMAIFSHNPNAFIDENINRLIKGSKLKIPGQNEVQSISYSEAVSQVRQHNNSWSGSTDSYNSYQTPSSNQPSDSGRDNSLDYGVELVGGDDSSYGSGGSSDSGKLRTKIIGLEEDLINKSSENDELRERVTELEDLVGQQKSALTLKNIDMTSLQNQLSQANQDGDLNLEVDDVWATDDQASVDGAMDDESSDNMLDSGLDEMMADTSDQMMDSPNTQDNMMDDQDEMMADTSDQMGNPTDSMNSVDDLMTGMTDEATDSLMTNQDESMDGVTEEASVDEAPATESRKFVTNNDESLVDKSINWIIDNLMYVGLGLLALLALIFVPGFLRSRAEDSATDPSFLDDIKSRGSDVNMVDTKAHNPINEELPEDGDETDDVDVDDSDDVLAALDRKISFEEPDDDAPDGLEDTDLTDDLDDFFEDTDDQTDEPSDGIDTDKEVNFDSDDEDIFDLDGFLDDDSDEDTDKASDDKGGDIEDTLGDDSGDGLDFEDELDLDIDDDLDVGQDDDLDFDEEVEFDVDSDESSEPIEEDLTEGGEESGEEVSDEHSEDTLEFDEELELDDEELEELELEEQESEEPETDVSDEEMIDLGLDFDDMLDDGDGIDTKIDLAKAYMDMGDNEGAKRLLEEVLTEGSETQVGEVNKLLKDM